MSIIATLFGIAADNWQWLVGAVMGLVALIGARQSGKNAAVAKQAKDSAKRAERGRQGAGKAAADIRDGKKPDDVLRDNDGEWK